MKVVEGAPVVSTTPIIQLGTTGAGYGYYARVEDGKAIVFGDEMEDHASPGDFLDFLGMNLAQADPSLAPFLREDYWPALDPSLMLDE